MAFLRKLFQLNGCSRPSYNKEDEEMENPKSLITDEENGLFLYPEESLCDQVNDLHYIPGAWRSPSLGQRMVDRVKDSPKLARRAMTKMTSPMVSRKQKKHELYIITLDVAHSSGVVGRGEGRADAW
jgi:hypothetical protein